MLNLQISASGDETIRTVLSESQNRITSMAMIHEQLYQSDSLAGINMHDYLDALIAFIMDSFDAKKKNITVDLSLPGITLDIDTAIPVGLIVNELVCNCMKYAFAKKDGGMITLTLTEEHGKQRSIVVEDNGEGLTPDFDVCNPGKLGLQMVTALAEQLGGTFAIANSSTGSGVRAVVEF
jgi:two-component sensor histidine kinase